MYEIEGPYVVSQHLPPIARRRTLSDLSPVADFPAGGPGFPDLPPPGSPPGGSSLSVVRAFLLPGLAAAQEVSASIFKIFWSSTSHPQSTGRYPQRNAPVHRFIHQPVHNGSVAEPAGRTGSLDTWPLEPSMSAPESMSTSSRTAARRSLYCATCPRIQSVGPPTANSCR